MDLKSNVYRCIFHRYTRKILILLIMAWCLIFVAATIVLPRRNNRKTVETKTSIDNIMAGDKFSTPSGAHEIDDVIYNANYEAVTSNAKGIGELGESRLNLHLWSHITGFDVSPLKQSSLFPCFPDRTTFVTSFTTETQQSDIGERVFGFLNPQFSGKYYFAITSDDASELWLSTNEDPRNVRLIAEVHDNNTYAWTTPGDYKKYPTQMSRGINLKGKAKYFIESLHKNGAGVGHVSVLWKPPEGQEFSIIAGQYLSPFCVDGNTFCICKDGREHLRIPSHYERASEQWKETSQYYYNTSTLDGQHLEGVLPVFPYEPSYVVKDGKVKKNSGIYIAILHHSSVYPKDATEIKKGRSFLHSPNEWLPNKVLPKADSDLVVNQFMTALESHHNHRFSLEEVVGLEGKEDKGKGTRYLLELKLNDTQENKYMRLAEYVVRDNASRLWFPKNHTWKRNATIHFIVPVKNQVKWVAFLVQEMSKLYLRTRDENVRLVIVDFESTDGDINAILKNSPFAQKYTLLKKSGEFHKTLAIQDAVKTISDPDSIVFLFDLHITIPITLLDIIRKHTIQRKMVFLPIVARLESGYTPSNPKGRWEELGSGLVAVYKSDWERFHGMNVDEFKTKWGGEDWDLLDRMLRVGLESERLKVPGFFHYYHSKNTMWDKMKT